MVARDSALDRPMTLDLLRSCLVSEHPPEDGGDRAHCRITGRRGAGVHGDPAGNVRDLAILSIHPLILTTRFRGAHSSGGLVVNSLSSHMRYTTTA